MRITSAAFIILGVFLVSVSLPACTGGPRPTFELQNKDEITYDMLGPDLTSDTRLGAGDIINVTFLTKALPAGETYKIQHGDTLLLEYHGAEHLNRNLIVRPDGKVTIPYLDDIIAVGKTTDDVVKIVKSKYNKQNLFTGVSITVSVIGANSLYRELQESIYNSNLGRSKDVPVGGDGKLRLPLLEPFEVAGRTLAEVENKVNTLYAQQFSYS